MRIRIISAAAVLLLAGAACSSDDTDSIGDSLESAVTDVGDALGEATDDAAETAARNIATQQGEEQFVNAGHALSGPLTCEATVAGEDAASIDISCTGVTEAGGQAMLTGATDELPGASVVSLSGLFTGTVDGAEVFSTDQLGG